MKRFLMSLIAGISTLRQRHRCDRVARATIRPDLEALETRELLSAGSLDLGFGPAGKVKTPFTGYASARAVAIQPNDHKIVAAGTSYSAGSGYDFALARYTPDGKLDASFSFDGKTTTDFGAYDFARAVAIQKDGKIVVAGYTVPDGTFDFQIALARYLPNGTRDPSFGNNGMVVSDFGDADGFGAAFALVLQNDGGVQKIVVAGLADIPGTFKFGIGLTRFHFAFGLARFNPDGTPDPGFGSNGKVVSDFGPGLSAATSLAIQKTGEIVAAGVAGAEIFGLGGVGAVALARYKANGDIDPSFGTSGLGQVVTPVGTELSIANAVALENDGRIVVAGSAHGDADFLLACYLPDGSLDNNFDGDGLLFTDFGDDYNEYAGALVIQGDSKIIAVGTSAGQFALARYNPDGSLDPGFGMAGKRLTHIGVGNGARANAATLQDDGKLVVVGQAWGNDGVDFALARYDAEFKLYDISKLGYNLYVLLSQQADQLTISDNGGGDITLYFPSGDGKPVTVHGIRQVVVQTFGGNDIVHYQVVRAKAASNSKFRPADLHIDLGDDDDVFTLTGTLGRPASRSGRPWLVDIKAGDGNDRVHGDFRGSLPAKLTVDLGRGHDVSAFRFQDSGPLPGWAHLKVRRGPGKDSPMLESPESLALRKPDRTLTPRLRALVDALAFGDLLLDDQTTAFPIVGN